MSWPLVVLSVRKGVDVHTLVCTNESQPLVECSEAGSLSIFAVAEILSYVARFLSVARHLRFGFSLSALVLLDSVAFSPCGQRRSFTVPSLRSKRSRWR